MTNAQKWAKKRNFTSFRLRGIIATLHNIVKDGGTLTSDEEVQLNVAEDYLLKTVNNWKEQTPTSRKMYVKEEVKK